MKLPLDQRPEVIAIAGPNGAGKTTFYSSHLHSAGLRFINEDVLARELNPLNGRASCSKPFFPIPLATN